MLSPEVKRVVDSSRFVDRPGLEIRAKYGIKRPKTVELAAGMKTEGPTVAQDAHFWIQCIQGEHPEDLTDLTPPFKIFSEDLPKKFE